MEDGLTILPFVEPGTLAVVLTHYEGSMLEGLPDGLGTAVYAGGATYEVSRFINLHAISFYLLYRSSCFFSSTTFARPLLSFLFSS